MNKIYFLELSLREADTNEAGVCVGTGTSVNFYSSPKSLRDIYKQMESFYQEASRKINRGDS